MMSETVRIPSKGGGWSQCNRSRNAVSTKCFLHECVMEIVLALAAGGSLAHFLHRRQEQVNKHGNDSDHHQQLDQRKGPTALTRANATHDENLPWNIWNQDQQMYTLRLGRSQGCGSPLRYNSAISRSGRAALNRTIWSCWPSAPSS